MLGRSRAALRSPPVIQQRFAIDASAAEIGAWHLEETVTRRLLEILVALILLQDGKALSPRSFLLATPMPLSLLSRLHWVVA